MWSQSFEKTFTTENHYRIEKSFDSEMLTFLEINRVPCYMIFDQAGRLVNYSASRPSDVEAELLRLL